MADVSRAFPEQQFQFLLMQRLVKVDIHGQLRISRRQLERGAEIGHYPHSLVTGESSEQPNHRNMKSIWETLSDEPGAVRFPGVTGRNLRFGAGGHRAGAALHKALKSWQRATPGTAPPISLTRAELYPSQKLKGLIILPF
ncbi:hypothetical protein D3C85_1259150 [compost metagenome]